MLIKILNNGGVYVLAKKSNLARTRTFATVVYPESAPNDWLQLVKSFHVQVYISPLHDKDHDPDGVIKKPHYHVLFCFDGVKSDTQILDIIKSIGGVGREEVGSTRGYARYLCHLDNPEKFQYNTNDVLSFGGGDYDELIRSNGDRYKNYRSMMLFIRENHITNFCDFVDYAMDHEPDWFHAICDNSTYVISSYCDSLYKQSFRQ